MIADGPDGPDGESPYYLFHDPSRLEPLPYARRRGAAGRRLARSRKGDTTLSGKHWVSSKHRNAQYLIAHHATRYNLEQIDI